MSKVNLNIDDIIGMIIEGKTYRQMADTLKVALTTLHDFTSKSEHSARVREALDYSSDTYADKAETVLLLADSDLVEIQRAKELAQYYKWKASKRSPKRYGDKISTEHSGAVTVTQITGMEIK